MEETELVTLCLEAACNSKESVEKWRRQRRSLERLPPHLAQSLLQRLLRRRLLFPSLLEIFKYNVEEINLRGENSVDAEWLAYLGAFRYLRCLTLAGCHRITSSALWPITGMSSLKEVDLSRCTKVTDTSVSHLISIPSLEKLWISETGVTANGVALLSSLRNLSLLDLGGLPVTDKALNSLQVLTKLEYLDLWGSKISNRGAAILLRFPKLSFLNLAWTSVTNLPNLSSLESLNMSNCTINSVFNGTGDKALLKRLIFSGATFIDEAETFLYLEKSFLHVLDISNSSLLRFCFLSDMEMLEHLNLSSTMIDDDSLEQIVCIGANLKYLNLSRTKVSSDGIGILAGHVPKLEYLSLSNTSIDDMALSYICMMPSLMVVDLSNTKIKGTIRQAGDEPVISSLEALQNLGCLEKLSLEKTQVKDAELSPLSSCKELSHLSLEYASLTDATLHHMASLPKLTYLSIREAVLTNAGLDSFEPSPALRVLDLRGCWLFTEEAILLFSRKHPLIEVKHEVVQLLPSEQDSSNRASPSQPSSRRSSRVNRRQEKTSLSQFFVDQRLKYSRDELLALQYSPLSLNPPEEADIITSGLQPDPLN